MKSKFILFVILLLFTTNVCLSKEPFWLKNLMELKPLHSTQEDVEKIFGKPYKIQENYSSYKIKYGKLIVNFSEGKCSNSIDVVSGIYDVEKNTIVYVDFYLDKPVRFKSLNIDTTKFEKEDISDVPMLIYKNINLGVSYSIYTPNWEKPELLNSISLFPSDTFSYLKCPRK